jgi:hypothetical protein
MYSEKAGGVFGGMFKMLRLQIPARQEMCLDLFSGKRKKTTY